MTPLQLLGAFLVASPFLAIVAFLAAFAGWAAVAVVFGGSALVIGVVFAGMYLLRDA